VLVNLLSKLPVNIFRTCTILPEKIRLQFLN